MLKGKRIFISGGNGVIGKELVGKLYQQGAIIFVGDLKPRPLDLPSEIIYRQGDLNYITKEEIEEFAPEYFIHLAATFERSVETYEFWDENHWHNVRLSTYLMTQMKDLQSLKKVVFASSYLIYNPELYTFDNAQIKSYRLKETDTIYPRNLTGVAKLNHEIELRFLQEFNQNRYRIVCARIYRSYGKNSRDIISRWIRALLKDEELTVYCKQGMFDYIYAGEVAEGLIRLADCEQAEGIINLGNDNARKVEEVLNVLKRHFPELKYKEIESNIPYEASQANMDFYNSVVGWKPQRQIEDTIPEMIEYEKKNGYVDELENLNFSVLVTSISRKIPMLKAIRKACKKLSCNIQLIGADVNSACIGKHFVDKFWQMPKINDLSIEHVIDFCKQNNVKAIIPSRDGELQFWAGHKTELKNSGINVMVSNIASINITLDKLLFNKFLCDSSIPDISTSDNINNLNADKFVVKERYGAGSLNIGVNLTKEMATLHSNKLQHPLFQEYIKGEEFSVDAYISNNNKIKGIIVRAREEVVNGESQITTTVNDPVLKEISLQLIEKLNLYGHVVLQVIKTANNKVHFIECNSRFGGASTLSLACGLDSFYWFLLESIGTSIDNYLFIKQTKVKTQIRYPEDIVINGTDF
ncbi:MAG: ATP-grasp domain-containing protein [Bacteroidia bacterium]|nr:ATP-grasp domain-containing protein [Bacteroidia bacterium]